MRIGLIIALCAVHGAICRGYRKRNYGYYGGGGDKGGVFPKPPEYFDMDDCDAEMPAKRTTASTTRRTTYTVTEEGTTSTKPTTTTSTAKPTTTTSTAKPTTTTTTAKPTTTTSTAKPTTTTSTAKPTTTTSTAKPTTTTTTAKPTTTTTTPQPTPKPTTTTTEAPPKPSTTDGFGFIDPILPDEPTDVIKNNQSNPFEIIDPIAPENPHPFIPGNNDPATPKEDEEEMKPTEKSTKSAPKTTEPTTIAYEMKDPGLPQDPTNVKKGKSGKLISVLDPVAPELPKRLIM